MVKRIKEEHLLRYILPFKINILKNHLNLRLVTDIILQLWMTVDTVDDQSYPTIFPGCKYKSCRR